MDVVEGIVWSQIGNRFDNSGASDMFYEKKWEWKYLRKACANLYLEDLIKLYMHRLQRSYLSIFLVLQTAIAIVHTTLLLLDDSPIAIEVFAYLTSIFIIWATLFITFREEIMREKPWIPFITSSIVVAVLISVDMIEPLYHWAQLPPLRPTYAAHILLVIYIFLPLTDNRLAFIMGLATTACYTIIFSFVTYRTKVPGHELYRTSNIVSEVLFLVAINFFGLYYRLINELVIRRTFLDRRQCVETSLMLKYARDQERSLLLSILPEHTAEELSQDISNLIIRIKNERRSSPTLISQPKTYVELHKNVTVLYADIVNYTSMTTTLEVKDLVETLHELFVKFDQASEENDVLRIKFLGDCYCCVSGVPKETPSHARNCVELGLRMIKIIGRVREKVNLPIDMRIGIHSGSILSGVIGAHKWQYDIWSRDVAIANKLESTGVPGMLHITEQVLNLLSSQDYNWREGTESAKKDPLLMENNIRTYLIEPVKEVVASGSRSSRNPGPSISGSGPSRPQISSSSRLPRVSIPAKNFMRNSMERYIQMMLQIDEEMKRELDQMPIGKFHFNKIFAGKNTRRITERSPDRQSMKNLSPIFLCFKDKRFEYSFLKEPDCMLKYSVLMGLVVFLMIVGIQVISNPLNTKSTYVVCMCTFILVMLVILSWFRKLWIMHTPPLSDSDDNRSYEPRNRAWKSLFQLSFHLSNGAGVRTTLYFVIICLLVVTSLVHMFELRQMEETLAVEDPKKFYINAWQITQSLILTICANFLFLRIYFIFKLLIGLTICCIYSLFIIDDPMQIFKTSNSINPTLKPMVAHLMSLWISLITFHLIDRQTEYISRIDYGWKQELLKEQEFAEITKETNNILLCNILPSHVAEIYLNLQVKDELYFEKYDKHVAVMFATVTDFNINIEALNILNHIICDFDEVLLTAPRQLKIEKIKVANWTYMAACGLEPGRGDSTSSATFSPEVNIRTSSGRREYTFSSWNNPRPSKPAHSSKNNPESNAVYVMTQFALQLMKTLRDFNYENFGSTFKLRVGISDGSLMAGVVGQSKPLYDIWGDSVNLASRMESTGMVGKIQVTKHTAEELQALGVDCEYRGVREVKGVGLMETFFVNYDENFQMVPIPQSTLL